jgi:mannose-6-phosphate isomerase-like protein (cupin superfamily)
VTVLEGRLRLKLGDQIVECGPYDSTFITAGVPHEFTAIGDNQHDVHQAQDQDRTRTTIPTD